MRGFISEYSFLLFAGLLSFVTVACNNTGTGEDVPDSGTIDDDGGTNDALTSDSGTFFDSGVQPDSETPSDGEIDGSIGPHPIGGEVSGLLGEGLVLQNNAGDDLAITENGEFVFSEMLTAGEEYIVTALTHPEDPEQTCNVYNGEGTVGYGPVTNINVHCQLIDSDNDGVPDIADPFPDDSTKPVPGALNTIYAHTSSQLYTMHPSTHEIELVGQFSFDSNSGSVTDVAVDQYNVLYAVTFNNLFVCDPYTAECFHLASLEQSFNGMTLVPAGTVDPNRDIMIGISNAGGWYRIDIVGEAAAELTLLGTYDSGYTSSGDAYSVKGVGTYAAVNKTGESSDVIVEVDPTNGTVLSEIGVTTGYTSLYGLAGTADIIFGFDAGGDIISINPSTGETNLIVSTSHSWWGAGVTTGVTSVP